MIKLINVDKVYVTERIETTALKNINLEVDAGEFVAVMGPSGCGKSTLLNIMGLLDQPTRGDVEIADNSVAKFGDRRLARMRNSKIGFIFQSFHLINDLSVRDNVEIPLLYRKMSSSERKRRALEALEKVGLKARTKHFPNQLSGGQRQRVAIARAIVGNPEIILADEPTGNLDSVMGAEIMDILVGLNKNENATIIMVTHDEHLAKQTERIVRLFDGGQVS
jgi:putative ABC transport system ATP-binding protein